MVYEFGEKYLCAYGFVPVYLFWVARQHAKHNGQNELATLSLMLMCVSLGLAIMWVLVAVAFPA